MTAWIPTRDVLPPLGVEVDTLGENGTQQSLVFADGLWWFPDRSMYVYYTPIMWREFSQ